MLLDRFRNIGVYAALGVMGLGAFAMLPGDETARPAVERIATVEPQRPSYLVEVAPAAVDSMETASVATSTATPAVQQMPPPIPKQRPVDTASLTVAPADSGLPPADSDEFPMDVAEPEPVVPPDARRLTVSSAVNLRAGPSTSTSTIKVLPEGAKVAVLGENRGWVNVALPDGQSGWVYERYLTDGSRPAAKPKKEQRTANVERRRERAPVVEKEEERRVTLLDLRRERTRTVDDDDGYVVRRSVALRDRPSRNGQRLFNVRRGEPVEIAEQRGNWVRIRIDGGISGWVQSRYIGD
jgi:SH3-like domain-containing protein